MAVIVKHSLRQKPTRKPKKKPFVRKNVANTNHKIKGALSVLFRVHP